MSWFKKFSWGGQGDSSPQTPAAVEEEGEEVKAEEADEVLTDDSRSLIRQLITSSGLKMGMDLTKITLPTFILEPRSMLQKLGDLFVHPDMLLAIPQAKSPQERMVALLRWYMSGYHRRPRGCKKPYNSVLGETFVAEMPCGKAKLQYVAEQVSHHPPKSAFFVRDDAGTVAVMGHYLPRSKFLGNSAASIAEGCMRVFLPEHGEEYVVTFPNVYVRGVFLGTLLMELGGKVAIRCPETSLAADITFHVKGYFTGEYNATTANVYHIKEPKTPLYRMKGKWTEAVTIQPEGGKEVMMFDYKNTKMQDWTEAESDLPNPTTVVWAGVTAALAAKNCDLATKEKTAIENHQRALRAERQKEGKAHTPVLFVPSKVGDLEVWEYIGEGTIPFPSLPK